MLYNTTNTVFYVPKHKCVCLCNIQSWCLLLKSKCLLQLCASLHVPVNVLFKYSCYYCIYIKNVVGWGVFLNVSYIVSSNVEVFWNLLVLSHPASKNHFLFLLNKSFLISNNTFRAESGGLLPVDEDQFTTCTSRRRDLGISLISFIKYRV